MVGEDIVRQDRLKTVHVCLRGKHRIIKQPRNVGEGSSADFTAEPGGGQFGVGSVQMFNLYFHITSDWNWMNREYRERKEIKEPILLLLLKSTQSVLYFGVDTAKSDKSAHTTFLHRMKLLK